MLTVWRCPILQHCMQNAFFYIWLLAEEQVQQEKQQRKQFHLTTFIWANTQKSLDKLWLSERFSNWGPECQDFITLLLKELLLCPKKFGNPHPNNENEFVLSTTFLHWQGENELDDVIAVFHLKVLLDGIFSLIFIVISFNDLKRAWGFGREVPFVNSSNITYNNCIFQ